MRCKNCGWENPAGSVKCEKCGAPISGDAPNSGVENGGYARTQREEPLRGTISEHDVFGNGSVGGEDSVAGGVCKSCGYPIGRGSSVCPNCGAPISAASGHGDGHVDNYNGAQADTPQYDAYQHAASSPRVENPRAAIPSREKVAPQKSGAHSGTINPWSMPEHGAFCTLKPIAWEGENVDHQAISYSGDNIVLNRANTDPNNQSITTKGQAELSFEDGAWYIRDKSTQKTTYVHAGRKTKLESGDIIILGNRQFEFKG